MFVSIATAWAAGIALVGCAQLLGLDDTTGDANGGAFDTGHDGSGGDGGSNGDAPSGDGAPDIDASSQPTCVASADGGACTITLVVDDPRLTPASEFVVTSTSVLFSLPDPINEIESTLADGAAPDDAGRIASATGKMPGPFDYKESAPASAFILTHDEALNVYVERNTAADFAITDHGALSAPAVVELTPAVGTVWMLATVGGTSHLGSTATAAGTTVVDGGVPVDVVGMAAIDNKHAYVTTSAGDIAVVTNDLTVNVPISGQVGAGPIVSTLAAASWLRPDAGSIGAADIFLTDGGLTGARTLVSGRAGLRAIAIDDQYVYFSDATTLSRVVIAGGTPVTLATNVAAARIRASRGFVYWFDPIRKKIYRMARA